MPLALTACTTAGTCTSAGCISGLQVTVRGFTLTPGVPAQLHVCLENVCRDTLAGQDPAVIQVDLPGRQQTPDAGADRELNATVRVTTAGRTLLDARRKVTLAKVTPNGERCGPVCYYVALTASPTGLAVDRG
jgi:hypothetical protein